MSTLSHRLMFSMLQNWATMTLTNRSGHVSTHPNALQEKSMSTNGQQSTNNNTKDNAPRAKKPGPAGNAKQKKAQPQRDNSSSQPPSRKSAKLP